MRGRHLGVAAALALSAIVTACGDDAADTDATGVDVTEPDPSPTTDPAFTTTIEPVTAEELGASWTDDIGCAPPTDLAAVTVRHHGVDGDVHEGRIVIAASVADDVAAVFAELFDAGFPIESIRPVSDFGGDDDASMAANNSSGYNCRNVAGTSTLSQHAFGLAIDINPLVNPWVHDGIVDPPEGAVYADRSRTDPGMILPDDVVVTAFARRGWSWGGDWEEPDYQHFYRD